VSASSQWHLVGNVPENYERYLVPSIFAPWALDLVEVAALRPRERVLDIACGTASWHELQREGSMTPQASSGWTSVPLCWRLLARQQRPRGWPPSGVKVVQRSYRWPTPHSMLCSANRVCSSFPIDQLRYVRCVEYWPQVGVSCLASGGKSSEARDLPFSPMH